MDCHSGITKQKNKKSKGFTIIELIIAAVVCVVALLGIGFVAADNQRSWSKIYNRINSDVAIESLVAKKTFEAVIRKAKKDTLLLDDSGTIVEVNYYLNADSVSVDGYARIYLSDTELNVDYGRLDPGETISTQTICSNVSSCRFSRIGTSVQMLLTLNNGSQTATVVTSAVMHN